MVQMRLVSRPGRSKVRVKAAAILILGLLTVDLVDSWCDPLTIPGLRPTVGSSQPNRTDACANVCVPDCFCCSSAAPAVTVSLMQEPTPLSDVPVSPVQFLAAGFSPFIDHIPITTV